jgi:hypothetical protein
MKTVQDVAKVVQERGVEFFLCSFVEMSGAPKAKIVPAHHLEDIPGERRLCRRKHRPETARS